MLSTFIQVRNATLGEILHALRVEVEEQGVDGEVSVKWKRHNRGESLLR